jgi:predicted MFS family arabinose efflux permease
VAADLSLDPGSLGALVGVGGAVAVLAQVPAGSGGDAWGRRPFFGLAMLLLLAAQLLRWGAPDATVLLVSQILAGAALGIAGVSGWALIADLPARSRQGQAFGILNASLSLGNVVGFLLAGALGETLGWRTESLALAALPLVGLPAVAWVPPRARGQGGAARRRGASAAMILRSLAHRRRLALAGVAALTLSAGQGGTYLLPFSANERALGPFAASLLLVPYIAGSVVAAPVAGRLGDRFGPRPVILAALVLGAAACVALVWGAAWSPVLVACFVAIGAGVNGALPLVALRVVGIADASAGMGTIIAGLRMGQSLGTFLGPLVAGAALARAGLGGGWLALAGCLLAAFAVVWTEPAQARRPRS